MLDLIGDHAPETVRVTLRIEGIGHRQQCPIIPFDVPHVSSPLWYTIAAGTRHYEMGQAN